MTGFWLQRTALALRVAVTHRSGQSVPVFASRVPAAAAAAASGPGILAGGGPHLGGGRLSTGPRLLDDHRAFAVGRRPHTHRLVASQTWTALWAFGLLGSVLSVCLFLSIRWLEQFRATVHGGWAGTVIAPLIRKGARLHSRCVRAFKMWKTYFSFYKRRLR